MQASGRLIDMRDPQAFSPRDEVGNAASEKASGGGQAIELQREFGTLITHANTLSEARPRPPT